MSDELRVIHEGITTHNIPGRCINNGENRDIIASKTPLFDLNGEVQGLIGCFIDRDLININDMRGKETKRRDLLTGLLNSRGISEEAHTFQDEYNLRNMDFVRMHVAIDDFSSINRQFGFDFGDKAIAALGQALKKTFGLTCAVGRYTGHQFVVLHQIHNREEAGRLRTRIKKVAADIRQIEGIALTLYLSVGYCVYSECEDLETQAQKAEIRLLADHDDHSTMENRLNRASEIFHLYDDLPIPYCVCRVMTDEARRVKDGIVFYVNHAFERQCGMDAAQLLGRRVGQLFPNPDAAWFDAARRAALENQTVVQRLRFWNTGREYHVTASPVIHPGYCGFTMQALETL
jgi:diguanylate cyclase (GGDEF)-like protein